jgi:hypothetical protein
MWYAMLAILGTTHSGVFEGFAQCATIEPNLPGRTGFPPCEAEAPILSRLAKVSGSIPAGKDRDENISAWDVVDKFQPNYFSPPSVLPDISPTRGEISCHDCSSQFPTLQNKQSR